MKSKWSVTFWSFTDLIGTFTICRKTSIKGSSETSEGCGRVIDCNVFKEVALHAKLGTVGWTVRSLTVSYLFVCFACLCFLFYLLVCLFYLLVWLFVLLACVLVLLVCFASLALFICLFVYSFILCLLTLFYCIAIWILNDPASLSPCMGDKLKRIVMGSDHQAL